MARNNSGLAARTIETPERILPRLAAPLTDPLIDDALERALAAADVLRQLRAQPAGSVKAAIAATPPRREADAAEAELRATVVRAAVEAAPPLTDEQCARLAAIVRGAIRAHGGAP